MKLYPLKFKPLSKYRIWGGNKLNSHLNKGFNEENIGESWEISVVENDESIVAEGTLKGQDITQLIGQYKHEFVGKKIYEEFGDEFPLLVKFIDAKTPLSIQVHPHDDIAKERHDSFGKNEMWYVMESEKDAELVVGFNEEISKEEYLSSLEQGKITEALNSESVSKGDTFYIPTGRVHAIGAGVLLAEIQQTSDITYRIYDFDRVDQKTGERRELHNELALDVVDFKLYDSYKTEYIKEMNVINPLVHVSYFKTNFLKLDKTLERSYSEIDSFVIYICTEGLVTIFDEIKEYTLKKGETILIPATIKKISLQCDVKSELLEVYY